MNQALVAEISEQIPQRLTVPEAAAVLRVGEETVRRYLRRGKLTGIKYGDSRADNWMIDIGPVVRLATHGGR